MDTFGPLSMFAKQLIRTQYGLAKKMFFVRVSVDVCSNTFYLVGLTAKEVYSTEQVVAGQLQREE